jgi:hypothetical protein
MRTPRGETQVCVTCRFGLVFSKFTNVNEIDGNQNQPLNQPGPNQPLQSLQGESSFGDSSGPFFSIYSKVAEEEDRKMVERWQKDADGILIFVSPPY